MTNRNVAQAVGAGVIQALEQMHFRAACGFIRHPGVSQISITLVADVVEEELSKMGHATSADARITYTLLLEHLKTATKEWVSNYEK